MRQSRFANSTTVVWLAVVLALVGYIAFHGDSSSPGGIPRADSAATFQLIEAESVVMSLPRSTAAPTAATVYAALQASRLLHGQVSYAAKETVRQRANRLYVAPTGTHSLMLWDRSSSGDLWDVSIVANPPGLKGWLVFNGPSSPGVVQGSMTSRRLN
jgi:hypothetical protein